MTTSSSPDRLLILVTLYGAMVLLGLIGVAFFWVMSHDFGDIVGVGLLILLGVTLLVVLLFLLAGGLSALNLTDAQHPFGLPDGSIRAMIALLLIIIWMIVSTHLFIETGRIAPAGGPAIGEDGVRLAQQLMTTSGTLVVAVAGFYFGSSSVMAARTALAEFPVIYSVSPNSGASQQDVELRIAGRGLNSAVTVRLVRGNEELRAGGVVSSDNEVRANVRLTAEPGGERWTVAVTTSSGAQAELPQAFEVTSGRSALPASNVSGLLNS